MRWFSSKPEQDEQQTQGRSTITFDELEVSLGDLMRGERATLGKSLLDVQRELHIRATYIAAIEAGDLSAFEAASFVAGYVRSYARYLGMDPDWCYSKFCAETGFAVSPELSRSSGSSTGVSVAETGANREFSQGLLSRTRLADDPDPIWRRIDPVAVGSITVMLFLILGVGFGGWTVMRELQRVNLAPADQSPEVLADFDPALASATPRLDPDEDSGLRFNQSGADDTSFAQGIVRDYRPEALDVPEIVSRDGPIASINPRESAPDLEATDVRSAIASALAEVEAIDVTPGGDTNTTRVTQDGPAQLELLAVRPSWIRVRGADGTILFEKVLDAGERYTVPQSEAPPTLRAGNSGSVYLLVDGTPFGPTAPGAQVVDQIALSPEAVVERFVQADLGGDSDLREFVDVAEVED
jgi:cytoskeletal protein RodZ